MKRLVILFLVSFIGILLLQLFGGMLLGVVPFDFKLEAVIAVVLIEAILYVLSIYTLIKSFKISEGRGLKVFRVCNSIFTLLLSLVVLFYISAMCTLFSDAHRYFNKTDLAIIPSTAVKAKVNRLVDYNGMSKDFILSIRSGNIDSNFVKNTGYKPNNEVWKDLQDKGAWFALERSVCYDKNTDCKRKLKGVSAMSRIINNPMILVAPVMIATYHLDEKLPVCSDEGLRLVPQEVYLDTVNTKIIAVYKGTNALLKCKYLQLSGLNARDFGFEWGIVKGSQNVYFPFAKNISKKIYNFQDAVVTGEYCKNSEAKCNVLSPIDDRAVFNVTSFPANIELKLWKKKPVFSFVEPDFNMEIRFIE